MKVDLIIKQVVIQIYYTKDILQMIRKTIVHYTLKHVLVR